MPNRVRNSRSSCFVELLLVVRHVAAFAAFAQAVALDRLGEDDGRLALAFDGRLVGGVDLFGIVAAAAHLLQLLVGVVLHHLEQLGILAEEVLADVIAAGDDVLLILAVDDFHHPLLQAGPSRRASSSGSQSPPQMTLMTFQPAPRNVPSSS